MLKYYYKISLLMMDLKVSKYVELLKIYYVVILWYLLNKNIDVFNEAVSISVEIYMLLINKNL
jgi:hypothetical protein